MPQRARDIAACLGYIDPPADEDYSFEYDTDYQNWHRASRSETANVKIKPDGMVQVLDLSEKSRSCVIKKRLTD